MDETPHILRLVEDGKHYFLSRPRRFGMSPLLDTVKELDVSVEDSTNRGRLDMALRFEGDVYVFEFKVVEQAGEGAALAQLVDRGYADKFRAPGVGIHLVGVEFSGESRNIAAFDVQSL